MRTPPAELRDFLRRYDPAVTALALRLRTVVLDEMAPCHEYIFAMRSKVVLLYGSTGRVVEDCICAIGVYRKHVTLGFAQGVDLDDPAGMLKGTGVRWRHARVTRMSDLDRPGIRAYLQQARAQAGLKPPRQRMDRHVVTRVKPPASPTRPK